MSVSFLSLLTKAGLNSTGAAAISEESLGRCCEPGNENIVGSSPLTCSPGGKDHITASNRPPLAKNVPAGAV
jgi:hypothetical protein